MVNPSSSKHKLARLSPEFMKHLKDGSLDGIKVLFTKFNEQQKKVILTIVFDAIKESDLNAKNLKVQPASALPVILSNHPHIVNYLKIQKYILEYPKSVAAYAQGAVVGAFSQSPQPQTLFKNKSNGQIHKFLQQEGCFNDKVLKKLSFRNAHECSQKKYKFFAETILRNKDATVNDINEKCEQGLMVL